MFYRLIPRFEGLLVLRCVISAALFLFLVLFAPTSFCKDPGFCREILESVSSPEALTSLQKKIWARAASAEGLGFLQSHIEEFRSAEIIRPAFREEDFLNSPEDPAFDIHVILRALHLLDRAGAAKRGRATIGAMEARYELYLLSLYSSSFYEGGLEILAREIPEISTEISPERISRYQNLFANYLSEMRKHWLKAPQSLRDLEPKRELANRTWKEELPKLELHLETGRASWYGVYNRIFELQRSGFLYDQYAHFFLSPENVRNALFQFFANRFEEPPRLIGGLLELWKHDSISATLHVLWKIKLAESSPNPDIKAYASKWLGQFFTLRTKKNATDEDQNLHQVMSDLKSFSQEFLVPSE
jgi:hypothetical protein